MSEDDRTHNGSGERLPDAASASAAEDLSSALDLALAEEAAPPAAEVVPAPGTEEREDRAPGGAEAHPHDGDGPEDGSGGVREAPSDASPSSAAASFDGEVAPDSSATAPGFDGALTAEVLAADFDGEESQPVASHDDEDSVESEASAPAGDPDDAAVPGGADVGALQPDPALVGMEDAEPEPGADAADGEASTTDSSSSPDAASAEAQPGLATDQSDANGADGAPSLTRTLSGELDAGWLSESASTPVAGATARLARVGVGIGRTLPRVGMGLPRPAKAPKPPPPRSSAEHAVDLPLVESRRPEPVGAESVDEAVARLEGTNRAASEALSELLRAVDLARQAAEQSTNATDVVVGLLRGERHTRLVEAARRVHTENEVAVLIEERDRLRRELAAVREGGPDRTQLVEQIRIIEERHAMELVRRQEVLESEHEQLRVQSEDRRRLNDELDALHRDLEQKVGQVVELESRLAAVDTERQALAEQLEAREQELAALRQQCDSSREVEQRLQVEAEATRRATQVNVTEQKRLREELEEQRRASREAEQEAYRLREQLAAVGSGEGDRATLVAERDALLVERAAWGEARAELEAELASERRALETALVDREFVDAEMAEWQVKAEDEARQRGGLEAEVAELRQTQEMLEAKISELHASRDALEAEFGELRESGMDPEELAARSSMIRGLALPGDEATRDELVERLLFAKQQIDTLLQERAQARLKLRQLEAQAKRS